MWRVLSKSTLFLKWLGFFLQVTNTFLDEGHWVGVVVHIATALCYTNSMLNPLLYAFLGENFRKSFIKALCCASLSDANRTLPIEHSAASDRHGHNRQRDNGLNLELKGEKNTKRKDKETPIDQFERDNITVDDNQAL